MLESAPNDTADERSDADIASLAFLSVTQHSLSDVSSVNLYYDGDGDDGDEHSTGQRASSASVYRQRRSTQQPRALSQLFTRKRLGLVVSVAAVGAVHGLVQSAAYPFFKLYLNADEYEAYAAERWLALPWLLKPVLALLTDAVPLRGRRRQPYLLVGWAWCLLFALVVVLAPSEEPYARSGRVVNVNAADTRTQYVALLTLATFGYVLADAACDGVMVQLGRPNTRSASAAVATLQATRFSAQMLATLLVALLCNSSEFGGDFASSVSVRGVAVLVVAVSGAALACAKLFFVDDVTELQVVTVPTANDRRSGWTRVLAAAGRLWRSLQNRAVWQAAAFVFASRVCFSYYATSMKAVYEFWTTSSPLTSGIFSALNCGVYASVALLFRRPEPLALTWRKVMVVAAVGSAVVALVTALFTVCDVVRSAFLALAFEQFGSAFDALAYFVALFLAVHAAEPGVESASYNAVLAAGNLAVPFAASLSQSIGASFDVYDDEYAQDTTHARVQAMYCVVVALVVKLASLSALPLLPYSAQHTRELKEAAMTTWLPALVASAGVGFLFVWAVLVLLLASFERTACLTVAGGEGC